MLVKKITINILTILAIMIVCPSAWAATYYISGSNGNDANIGSLNNPWKTIGKANSTLSPGDTVYLRGGTYTAQYINPSKSGAPGQPITYSNYDGEKVTIRDASYGININGKSYIKVTGIDFYNLDHFFYITSGQHNEISFCKFDKFRNYTWHGARIYKNSQYNWIHHCEISRWGSGHSGAILDIGDEYVTTDNSYYNLIEDNKIYYGGHHVLGLYSRYSVIRNNYFQNDQWENGGYRVIISEGYAAELNLIEGNRIAFGYDDGVGFTISSPNHIVRYNYFYRNDRAGVELSNQGDMLPANNNHIYSNTFFHNGDNTAAYYKYRAGLYLADWGDGDPQGNVIKNNIFHQNGGGSIAYYAVSASQIVQNNWDEAGDPLLTNTNGTDPMDPTLPVLDLVEGSPAKDAGTWLTTTSSASGTGVTFQVADAYYFMDGWGIVKGDTIQLQGQDQKVQITDVNYANNTITVSTPLTWVKGQGVSLVFDGQYPDLGGEKEASSIAAPTGLKLKVNN